MSISAQDHSYLFKASPERTIATPLVPNTPASQREWHSKTSMNFAPNYDAKRSVFTRTLDSLTSSIEKTSPVKNDHKTLPHIETGSFYNGSRPGN
jgi:hypothetical protein